MGQIWHIEQISQVTVDQFRVLVDVTESKEVVGLWENKASKERLQGQQ